MQIEIVRYAEQYKPYFRSLNEEWLNKYFSITSADRKILENPEKILESGGQVLFALCDGVVAGTCAYIPHGEESYELIKMGVTERFQGRGIGYHLIREVIAEAKKTGMKKVLLETASSLHSAISLYKRAGFVQYSPEEVHPDFGRMTFKMSLEV